MSQRSRKRENQRKRAHQIVYPRNGYTIRMSWIDEAHRNFALDIPTVWEPVEEFENPEFAKIWRQANPIQGEVVKRNDDGRVGPD